MLLSGGGWLGRKEGFEYDGAAVNSLMSFATKSEEKDEDQFGGWLGVIITGNVIARLSQKVICMLTSHDYATFYPGRTVLLVRGHAGCWHLRGDCRFSDSRCDINLEGSDMLASVPTCTA